MINLLPEHKKKELFREYSMRVAIVSLCALLLLELAVISAFAPGYMALKAVLAADKAEFDSLTAAAPTGSDETEKDVESLKRDLDRLKKDPAVVTWSMVMEDVLRVKSDKVKITAVAFDQSDGIAQIQLRGVALDRDTLTVFRKDLRADPHFAVVDFPASAFLKESNIEFTMKITLKTKQKA